MPSTRGAPAKPARSRCLSSSWTAGVHALTALLTVAPMRTAPPSLPPSRRASTSPPCLWAPLDPAAQALRRPGKLQAGDLPPSRLCPHVATTKRQLCGAPTYIALIRLLQDLVRAIRAVYLLRCG